MNTSVVCPECQRDDLIQKVSGVYENGLSTETVVGRPNSIFSRSGYMYITNKNQTLLSQKLAPPPEPTSYYPFLIVPLVIGSTMLIVSVANGFGVAPLIWALFWFLIGGFGLWLEKTASNSGNNSRAAWQNAMEVWNRLYYCARNDCVFDPETGVSVSTREIRVLLYPERKSKRKRTAE